MSDPLGQDEAVHRGCLRPLSVAPMMDRTDRHFRMLARRFSKRSLLYTEMLTCGAVLHGDRERLLGFSEEEKPVAFQLGGDSPEQLAESARIVADLGYDEVNLNVGCPSDRVQSGAFGASLMLRPERVADAVRAMRQAVDLPVTVKHRIGVDDHDSYEHFRDFVRIVAASGCDRFTVHARKAWLSGLSPKQNREVPPLRYEEVHRLKSEMPDLHVEINGGIMSLDEVRDQLGHVDAVMIGRAAYDTPEILADADRLIFGDEGAEPVSAHDVVRGLLPYVDWWLGRGGRLHEVSRHLLNLFGGRPGARAWRRTISEESGLSGAGPELLSRALENISEDAP